jgi:hypothetical protein
MAQCCTWAPAPRVISVSKVALSGMPKACQLYWAGMGPWEGGAMVCGIAGEEVVFASALDF